LIDLDKESWYPLLCIKNNWFPEHLGPAFLDVYTVLFDDRKLYKVIALQDKSNIDANTIQKALKLSLVSVYGKLGSEYSPLNCSKTQLGICINGQLLLMQCIERVMQRSKAANYKAELIFSNTDGFMVSIDRGYLEELKKVAAELSDETEILLEYEECDAMYMRDVNNFINIKADGSVKLKGAYEIDKDFHKNGSTRIVSIAAANYFINEISPEDTIKNHLKRSKLGRLINNDYEIYYSKKHNNKVVSHGIYDFMILKKIDSRFQFKQVDKRGNTTDLQKSIRYLMTTTGCKLIKQTVASKKIALLEATKTSYEQVFNEMPDCKLESQEMMCFEKSIPINYNHYIKQAYKLIHSIEGYGEQLLF
jgi:DNA polymerase elongation subunit (family B)